MLTRTSPSRGEGSPEVTGFYEPDTGSIAYAVRCPATSKGALIDVVMGFDPAEARTDPAPAQAVLDHVRETGLEVAWVLDTHPHADHLMAQAWLARQLDAPRGIGARVAEIAELWRGLYNLPTAFDPAADFDRLFEDGDTFRIGDLEARVMLSPGHTLGSVTYVIGDAAFVHDTLMQPDFGTARADFPGGSAAQLYESISDILALPEETRLFVGHDYGTDEREDPRWVATVAEHRESNVHVGGGRAKEAFVRLREERDAGLSLPDRMLFALQYNLRGGGLPPAEDDGHSYFKIPANRF
jgi:glyoxylase-like metal-dependent hydrolase (beta-lactamase superfamily II)